MMDIPQVTSHGCSETGIMGQEYLATGKQVALRRWQESPGGWSDISCRDYETVGYVLTGILQLDLDGQTAKLAAGDSWMVPEKARHRYRIIEPIVAIEATSPPARFNNRDQPTAES